MSGTPRIKIVRRGLDFRSALPKDFALNTLNPIQKFYRLIRSTSTQTVKHGLPYEPTVFFLSEITSNPKKIGHALGGGHLDGDDIFLIKGTHTPYWTGSYQPSTNDAAIIALLTVEPLPETDEKLRVKTKNPRVRVGSKINDFEQDLDGFYDSLKVFSSGNLTLNLPQWTANNITDVDKRSVTYNHNLGYIPFFAPFVPYETSLTVHYGWLYQWHSKGGPFFGDGWLTGQDYIPLDNLQMDDFEFYECIKRHTSDSTNRPGTGANWTTYWKIPDYGGDEYYPDDIDLNSLEDVKIVFGGVGGFMDVVIRVWATSTQLVVEAERWADTTWGPVTMKAQTITMDYTVFYNRVDEEFNLLTN